jgi:formylglycine-generating enzyme required for sulfatase activity
MSKLKEQESLIIDHILNETQYNDVPKSSRVFISYSHDSSKHEECVLQLSNRLCKEGIDSTIDQYETSSLEGWFLWMINQIEEADFVLTVCTEKYERRVMGKVEAGKGLGAKWEGAIITKELYYSEANNKCIPIVFSLENSKYIPSILKHVTYYNLGTEEGYIKLYSRLTGQKLIKKPAIGELRQIPPKNLFSALSTEDIKETLVESNQKPVIGKLRKINSESQSSKIPEIFISDFTGMEFVLIPAGEFMMGSQKKAGVLNLRNLFSTESPAHEVTIEHHFYLGKFPVTQKQWIAVMGENPSKIKDNNRPVENISWGKTQEFIKKLNEIEGTDKYRLPSEAEWEYACRAGTQTKYSFGDNDSKLNEYAWYFDSSTTQPVGKKEPNPWGLYDMYGNVFERVQDTWHSNYIGAPSDGSARKDRDSSCQPIHGGAFHSFARDCHSAYRLSAKSTSRKKDIGFRLLREL